MGVGSVLVQKIPQIQDPIQALEVSILAEIQIKAPLEQGTRASRLDQTTPPIQISLQQVERCSLVTSHQPEHRSLEATIQAITVTG